MTTNTNTQTPCALGVSDRALSDFRSDGLGAREMERLRAHVAQCPACQARLAEYEATAQRLRAQPEPNGHAQLWQNVRASIAATETPVGARNARHGRNAGNVGRSHSRQVWAALGSIAAVLALSVGFVALFVSHNGWPAFGTHGRATATPIVIHSGSLTWRQVIVPKGFPSVDQFSEDQASTYDGAYIAQGNGNTAYACQANRKKVAAPIVWATHDAGATWSVITPSGFPASSDGCRLTLDANAANTLIVSFFKMLGPGKPPLPDSWTTYASFNGGATWTKPDGLNDGSAIYLLASARGQVYATRTTYAADGTGQMTFSVSDDQMRTWSAIDANLPETQPNPPDIHVTGKVFQIWVNPVTGEALELTYAGSLWSTRDKGAHWRKITYPEGVYTRDPHAPTLLVGSPTASGYLTICGAFFPVHDTNNEQLECTADDGQTWRDRAALNDYPIGVPTLSVVGMGHDGSIFAGGFLGNGRNNAFEFYQLPPGEKYWRHIGTALNSENGVGYQVAPAGDHMVFWLFPGVSTTSDISGSKTTTQPYYYVANYP